ncbi:MAG: zinc ribbon domain-containing protein [Planctomycetes bacterium]|nr:zinc ribbon domain-containing protein [Planctomycetota bacterium]
MTRIIYLFVTLFVLTGAVILIKAFAANRKKVASNNAKESESAQHKCNKCGHLNSPDGDFCGRCGQSLKNEPQALATGDERVGQMNEPEA